VVLWDPADSGLSLGPIFNIAAAYKLKHASYSLSAGLDLSPDQDGTLKNLLSSNFSVSHQVNDLLSLGLSAGYSSQANSGEPRSSVLRFTPSLNYQLSQAWNSALSYQFVQSDDADTSAHSNAVSLTISYGTVLLP
jgi:hypothetical protein